jgi:hypothetical protein
LHGGDVALVEGAGRGGQHFEHTERPAVVAQGRNEDGAHAEAAAAGEVDARVALGIVAEHDFAGAHGFGGDAGFSLQAHAEIGSGASSAGAANDFVAGAQGDRRPGGSGKVLGALRNGADCRLEI